MTKEYDKLIIQIRNKLRKYYGIRGEFKSYE